MTHKPTTSTETEFLYFLKMYMRFVIGESVEVEFLRYQGLCGNAERFDRTYGTGIKRLLDWELLEYCERENLSNKAAPFNGSLVRYLMESDCCENLDRIAFVLKMIKKYEGICNDN